MLTQRLWYANSLRKRIDLAGLRYPRNRHSGRAAIGQADLRRLRRAKALEQGFVVNILPRQDVRGHLLASRRSAKLYRISPGGGYERRRPDDTAAGQP